MDNPSHSQEHHLRPRLDFAPAVPRQSAIDDRGMDRVAELVLIGLLYQNGDDDLTPLRLLSKRSEQPFFFLGGEVAMITTTPRLVPQRVFPLAEVTGWHRTHGTRLPA